MSGLPLYVSYTIAPDSSAQAQTFTMSMTPPAGDTRTFRCHLYDEQGVRKTTFDNADGVRIMTTPISLAHYPGNKITARLGVGADTRDVVIPLVFANGVAKALDGQCIEFVWTTQGGVLGSAGQGQAPLAELDPDGVPVVLSYDIPEPTSYRGRQIIKLDFPESYFVGAGGLPADARAPLYVTHTIERDDTLDEYSFGISMTTPAGDERTFTCRLLDAQNTERAKLLGRRVAESGALPVAGLTGNRLVARLAVEGGSSPDIEIPLDFGSSTAAVALAQQRVSFAWSASVAVFSTRPDSGLFVNGGIVVGGGGSISSPSPLYVHHSITPEPGVAAGTFRIALTPPADAPGTFTCKVLDDAGERAQASATGKRQTSAPHQVSGYTGKRLRLQLNVADSGMRDVEIRLAFAENLATALSGRQLNLIWSPSYGPVAEEGGFYGDDRLLGSQSAVRAGVLNAKQIEQKYELAQKHAFFDPLVFPNVQVGADPASRAGVIEVLKDLTKEAVTNQLLAGYRLTVYRDASGRYTYRFIPEPRKGVPALLLVEYYRLSSFPTRYGAGRTIKTFSLLPGERTRIKVKTYKRTEKSVSRTSSILDSTTEDTESDFERSVQGEQSRQTGTTSALEYHAEAQVEAKVSWGWGNARGVISGGVKGGTNATRDELAKNVTAAVSHNAARASARRDIQIDTSLDIKEEQSEQQAIERVLENVNVSRTLNFVFRQMNQEFITLLHLVDVRVAFFNGFAESRYEVPLPELEQLLTIYIEPGKKQEVLTRITEELQSITDIDGTTRGDFVTTGPDKLLRVNQQATSKYAVGDGFPEIEIPGVLISADSHVLRTDGVVVDTFLGRGNGLDSYSTGLQEQAVQSRAIENARQQAEVDRIKLAIELIKKRDTVGAELYQRLFPGPSIVNHIEQADISGSRSNGNTPVNPRPQP